MRDLTSRRDILGKAGLVLAGTLTVLPVDAWATRPVPGVVYRLRATDRCSCRACHGHAAHKLFATRAAADRGRSHTGCQCEIVRAKRIPKHQWQVLFGTTGRLHHTSVDRRRKRIRRVLAAKQSAT